MPDLPRPGARAARPRAPRGPRAGRRADARFPAVSPSPTPGDCPRSWAEGTRLSWNDGVTVRPQDISRILAVGLDDHDGARRIVGDAVRDVAKQELPPAAHADAADHAHVCPLAARRGPARPPPA